MFSNVMAIRRLAGKIADAIRAEGNRRSAADGR
jgi:hypothetical protein